MKYEDYQKKQQQFRKWDEEHKKAVENLPMKRKWKAQNLRLMKENALHSIISLGVIILMTALGIYLLGNQLYVFVPGMY